MSISHILNIKELEHYLHTIFFLEKKSVQKDAKVEALEFELELERLIKFIGIMESLQHSKVDYVG